MTVIVGLKHKGSVYLGCDSQGSSGWNKRNREDSKIFTAHGIGYGFTSSYRMGQIIKYHAEEALHKGRETDVYGYVVKCLVPMYRDILGKHGYKQTIHGEESGGTFLIAIDGHLFCIHGDFQVAEVVDDYDSVGCGESYALGSLFSYTNTDPEKRINKAIDAAKHFSNGCGGETKIIKVG